MARFEIKAPNGTKIYKGTPKYVGTFGKVSYLEFAEIASPVPINWAVGDYVDYDRTGMSVRYKLYSIPRPKKQARRETYGAAFVYTNVQFFAPTKILALTPFLDVVLEDNGMHFSSMPEFSTYESIVGIAQRIQANLDLMHPGEWNITVYDPGEGEISERINETVNWTFSDNNCLEVLDSIYNERGGIGWVYSIVNGVNTITLGRPNVQDSSNTTATMQYGKGRGLTVIKQSNSSTNDIATRILVYGSNRNIPSRYYNKQSIYNAESVYIPNLMLPVSTWGTTGGVPDARKAFLDASSSVQAQFGIIPKIVRFDGNENEEIYPSLKNLTISDVVSAGLLPSTPSGWSSSSRIDQIATGSSVSDDGQVGDGTSGARYHLASGVLSESARSQSNIWVELKQSTALVYLGGAFFTYSAAVAGTVTLTTKMAGTFSLYVNGSVRKFASMPKVYASVVCHSSDGITEVARQDISFEATEGEVSFSFEGMTFTSPENGTLELYICAECELTGLGASEAQDAYLGYSTEACKGEWGINYTISSRFTIEIPPVGFDISKQTSELTDGYATLNMLTGGCAGRSFTIVGCKYNESGNTWVLTCVRQKDDTLNQYFPNNYGSGTYQIASGDEYVLTDLQMPDAYVEMASVRMHSKALALLAQLSSPKYTYEPEIDAKVMQESLDASAEIILCEGLYMPVMDADIIPESGNTDFVLIDTLTIDEGESNIPIYKVTLRDEKRSSFLQTLSRQTNKTAEKMRAEDIDSNRVGMVVPGTLLPYNGIPTAIIEASDDAFDMTTGTADPEYITLTALTYNIICPSYQWQYWDADRDAFVDISGAVNQAYKVLSNGPYYPEGDIVAEIRCVVTHGDGTSVTYSDTKTIAKAEEGANGVTIALSSPAILIAANEDAAISGTYSTTVVALKGVTLVPATVGTVSNLPTGISHAIEGQTITFGVSSSLVQRKGSITIPATAAGITTNLQLSWALSLKGGPGNPGSPGTTEWIETNVDSLTYNPNTSYFDVDVLYASAWSKTGNDPATLSGATVYGRLIYEGDDQHSDWFTMTSSGVFTERIHDGQTVVAYQFALSQLADPSATKVVSIVLSGTDGYNGKSVKIDHVTLSYQYSSSSTVVPTGGWSTTRPGAQQGQYLWIRSVVTYVYSDGTGQYNGDPTYSVEYIPVDGVGEDAATYSLLPSVTSVKKDKDGHYSVASVTCQRYKAVGASTPAESSEGTLYYKIDDNVTRVNYQAVDPSWFTKYLNFIWIIDNKQVAVCSVTMVIDGDDGKGVRIASTTLSYQYSASSSEIPTGNWSSTRPDAVQGLYLWIKSIITYAYTDGSGSYNGDPAYTVEYVPVDGDEGPRGPQGRGVRIDHTTITYLQSTNGSTVPTGNWSPSRPTPVKGWYLWIKSVITYAYTDGSDTYDGDPTYTVEYTPVDGEPGPPGASGQNADYPEYRYASNNNADVAPAINATHRYPVGWSTTMPTPTSSSRFIWMTSAMIYGENVGILASNWSNPVRINAVDGNQGVNVANIILYKAGTMTSAPTTAPGNSVYDFSTGELTATASLNGWTQDIPTKSMFEVIYVTQAYKTSNDSTVSVRGGWIDNGGDWSRPQRFTGDTGLMGKVMRGVNEYSSSGIGGENYMGLDDLDSSHIYYDVVYVGSTPSDRDYYYCKVCEKNGTQARYITPGTDSDVWVIADKFDFVATRVLLAENAAIDIMSGNAVYMYDTDGHVITGMQGGQNISFFAGADESSVTTAPFKVYANGSIYAEDATIDGSIEARGNNFADGDGYHHAIKSNNGLFVNGGRINEQVTASVVRAFNNQDGEAIVSQDTSGDEGIVEITAKSGSSDREYTTIQVTPGGATVRTGNEGGFESGGIIMSQSLNNLTSIRKIVVCTNYPTIRDDDTLYIKIDNS